MPYGTMPKSRIRRRYRGTTVRVIIAFVIIIMVVSIYNVQNRTTNISDVNANDKVFYSDDYQGEKAEDMSLSDNAVTSSRGPTLIVLTSHSTSLSSLVAYVFHVFPGSFYIFEPLHGILPRTTYLNGTSVTVDSSNRDDIYREEVHKLLSCNFEDTPLYTILFRHRFETNDSLYPLYNCILSEINALMAERQFDISKELDVAKLAYLFFDSQECAKAGFCISSDDLGKIRTKCLMMSAITERCKRAPFRVFKFIRLSMESASVFLPHFPSLKIILLLRDPRANFVTQKRLLNVNITNDTIRELASRYCSVVWRDLTFKQNIIKTYPNSIYTLQYEVFADDPITVSEKLYSFIELPFVDRVEKTVWNNKLSGKKLKCNFCVSRGNSSGEAGRWRFHISEVEYMLVNSYCSYIIGRMGLAMPAYEELTQV